MNARAKPIVERAFAKITAYGKEEMSVRARGGTSRAALLAPDAILSGRRFNRAGGPTRAVAAQLDYVVLDPGGADDRPSIALNKEARTLEVVACGVS